MQKKDNLITKFRDFWCSLNWTEKKHIWDILTALRGNDDHSGFSGHEKVLTTARIRGELFGENSFSDGIGGYSHRFYSQVPSHAKKVVRQVKAKFINEAYSHFHDHVRNAIQALNHYRPKKSMRDLQKFMERG